MFENDFQGKSRDEMLEKLTELLADETKSAKGLRRDVERLKAQLEKLEKRHDELKKEVRK